MKQQSHQVRTDLAMETVEALGEQLPQGVKQQQEEKNGLRITRMEIAQQAQKAVGKPAGNYVTIEVESFDNTAQNYADEISVVADEIRSLLPAEGTILAAGLGNNDITPDALGPKTIDGIFATRHIPDELARQTGLSGLRQAAAIAPGVLGQTGMETSEILSSLVKQIRPAALIVVDALASKSVERLGKTIQISNTGISPGSGVQNKRKEISPASMGVPVIAIGVPTVVDMATIAQELSVDGAAVSEQGKNMMVTPREIDLMIEKSAKTLSLAINQALQPMLALEDITALMS